MNQSDFERFAKALIACSEVYGKPLSTEAVKLYWAVLKDYEYSDIEKAFGVILRTHRYATMPTPAHFVEAMDNSEVRAIQAERDLQSLQIMYGPDQSVEIDDPALVVTIQALGGWVDFNDKLREANKYEYGQLIKDFKLLYVYHLRDGTRPKSMRLIGRFEIQNKLEGWQDGDTLKLPDGCTRDVTPDKVTLLKHKLKELPEPERIGDD